MKIKFICKAIRWFDKVNGNTYHSVRITRVRDGKTIVGQFQYGYGDQYRYIALEEMIKARWIHKKYKDSVCQYEIENDYPIYWDVSEGKKRDCVSNGIL